ncbi:MAG: hypothetical protein ABIH25_05725 [Candidatus Woesearchaeota archaeon]
MEKKKLKNYGIDSTPIDIDEKTWAIFDLCSKEKNIYQISKEIGLAYKNTMARLKSYEKKGWLKKHQIQTERTQTIYKLTPKGISFYKLVKDIFTKTTDETGRKIDIKKIRIN